MRAYHRLTAFGFDAEERRRFQTRQTRTPSDSARDGSGYVDEARGSSSVWRRDLSRRSCSHIQQSTKVTPL